MVEMNMAVSENLSTIFSKAFFPSTPGRSVIKSAVITSYGLEGISVGSNGATPLFGRFCVI